MLNKIPLDAKMEETEYKSAFEGLAERMMTLQRRVREKGVPVMIVFEGWNAAGKGVMISKLIENMDPRGYKVYVPHAADEPYFPPMKRFWQMLPARGQIALYDGSWYGEPDADFPKRLSEILPFERQLADDGYVLIKFFLHIGKKEQAKRFEALEGKKSTRWRVTKADWRQNERYEELNRAFDDMLELTERPETPWTAVPAHDKRYAAYRVYETVIARMEAALDGREAIASADPVTTPGVPDARPLIQLKDVLLNKTIPETEYALRLKKAQDRLSDLHNRLYLNRVPLVLAFEGWDAAGKGGCIRRLMKALDPRGYEVIPISAPTKEELAHPFLWRFWRAIPKDGHIVVFDRSWYGRVLVERVEGFAKPEEWKRAYREINQFERSLTDHGAVVMKFWLHIDQDEQLRRFETRRDDPLKQWKITDEDWRNRDKWPQYEEAVDEMLRKTNTEEAPWIVIEGNDKRYARVKLLESVVDAVEARLNVGKKDK